MARTFANGSANRISVTNPSSNMFKTGSDWTILAFAKFSDTDNDNRGVVTKFTSGANSFSMYAKQGAAPVQLAAGSNGVEKAHSNSNISEGVWYLVGCRQTGASNLLETILLSLDLATVDIGASTGTNNHAGNSANVSIGNGQDTTTPLIEMDGSIAFVAYWTRKLDDNEIRQYARDPLGVWAKYKADALFYLPLIGASTEPDWSGNGRSGAVKSSPGTGDMPPVAWRFATTNGHADSYTSTVTGDLSSTLGVATSSAAGQAEVQGAGTPTLGALTASAAGAADVQGTASNTLGALTTAAAGAVDVQGASAPTLGTLTSTATGAVLIQGTTTSAFGALLLVGEGTAVVWEAVIYSIADEAVAHKIANEDIAVALANTALSQALANEAVAGQT